MSKERGFNFIYAVETTIIETIKNKPSNHEPSTPKDTNTKCKKNVKHNSDIAFGPFHVSFNHEQINTTLNDYNNGGIDTYKYLHNLQ